MEYEEIKDLETKVITEFLNEIPESTTSMLESKKSSYEDFKKKEIISYPYEDFFPIDLDVFRCEEKDIEKNIKKYISKCNVTTLNKLRLMEHLEPSLESFFEKQKLFKYIEALSMVQMNEDAIRNGRVSEEERKKIEEEAGLIGAEYKIIPGGFDINEETKPISEEEKHQKRADKYIEQNSVLINKFSSELKKLVIKLRDLHVYRKKIVEKKVNDVFKDQELMKDLIKYSGGQVFGITQYFNKIKKYFSGIDDKTKLSNLVCELGKELYLTEINFIGKMKSDKSLVNLRESKVKEYINCYYRFIRSIKNLNYKNKKIKEENKKALDFLFKKASHDYKMRRSDLKKKREKLKKINIPKINKNEKS